MVQVSSGVRKGYTLTVETLVTKRDHGMRPLKRGDPGFTMIELSVTILVIGVLLTASTLSYLQISRGMRLTGARKQVEGALARAKTVARQENVSYRLVFYSDSEPDPKRNSYEYYCNTEVVDENGNKRWELKPVDKSLTGESVVTEVVGEDTHYYIKLGNNVQIVSTVSVTISPAGTLFRVTPATVNLRVSDRSSSVSIDEVGKITVQ